jgi:hypothetical protein
MRADTRTISIDVGHHEVFDFLADPRSLPRWAVGFARSIREQDGRWLVATGGGEIPLRIDADRRTGVVDFVMTPAPGVEALAGARVLPRGSGAEVIFTQLQPPGMPDELFDQNVRAVIHELTVLKAVLEVACPL